jgi:hypothetical protein
MISFDHCGSSDIHMSICNKLANQIAGSHRKHPFDFKAANRNADSHEGHRSPCQGIYVTSISQ